MNNFKLAVGPMHIYAVDAVFHYSQKHGVPLALIASKNQVDYDGGYAFPNTRAFMSYVSRCEKNWPKADVAVCRDHCGPGFKDTVFLPIEDCESTVKADIAWGFNLIHIDTCRSIEPDRVLRDLLACIPETVGLEVGTDENDGGVPTLAQLEAQLQAVCQIRKPDFFVVRTGSLVLRHEQAGIFDKEFVGAAHKLCQSYGVRLKEHNADYLTPAQIRLRKGRVDAMNIAPQLGFAASAVILQCAVQFELMAELDKWLETIYLGRNWVKWQPKSQNPYSLALIAGHYHLHDASFTEVLLPAIKRHIDVETLIREACLHTIATYGRVLYA